MQTITPELEAILVSKLQAGPSAFAGRVEVDDTSYRCTRMSIDKSLRMQSDQAEFQLTNEDRDLGWGSTNIFPTNSRIKAFQWYGDPANEVQVFDGLIDEAHDHRDVLTTTLVCRDRFALLIDQHFVASAPQEAGEAGAVRTPANGVYLSMEVGAILADILDRVGWPSADREIADTSMVLTEFILGDGSSYADAVTGDNSLTTYTGYDAWSDEGGIFHFAPTPASDIVSVDVEPVYTWRAGVDLIELDDTTDQYELITRVKVRGPMTTLKPAWTQLWETKKISQPVGIWFDPSAPLYIRVIDRATKKLFKLRQSDRQIVSSVYLGGVIAHPLGISGDPSNAAIYWVLDAPWRYTGSTSGNSVKKVRKSDNHVLATYALPNGRWSALKVSATWMWLTNLDTDRFYRRHKTDASASANYQHTVGSTVQANPSGIMIDGTTLHLFWSNGGTTARFLVCDESDPTMITSVVKTSGTTLHGGEMDTVTHTECWGDSDSLGIVAKFTLVNPVETTVSATVANIDLEDELGGLAELEDRVHDVHPLAAAHPFEIRRTTLDLTKIDSRAQAYDTARFWLDKLGRRKRVVDAGILGNPAIQKQDLVRIEDPVSGVFQNFVLDTYRSEMAETFLGTVSLVRGGIANDEITEPDPPPVDPGGDAEEAITFCATDSGGDPGGADDIRATPVYRGTFVGAAHDPVIHVAEFEITGNPPVADWTGMGIWCSWNGGALFTVTVRAESVASPGTFNQNMCWNAGSLTRCSGTEGGSPNTTTVGVTKPGTGTDVLEIWGINGHSPTGPTQFCLSIGAVLDDATDLVVPNEL